MQPWHQSPRRLSAVCFFVLALTFHARAADPNHLIAFTPASIGSYSICSALNDSFVVGNISAGVDCESRGFVSFSIAAATSTIVAGDLFIPLYLVSSSSGDVEVELHAVNATLVDLLNANSREQIFQSLGNGPILGKALVPAGVFQFQNYQRTALATVPLTPLGVETLNGARGKQVLLGV